MQFSTEFTRQNQNKSMESDKIQDIGISSPCTGHVGVKKPSDDADPPLEGRIVIRERERGGREERERKERRRGKPSHCL